MRKWPLTDPAHVKAASMAVSSLGYCRVEGRLAKEANLSILQSSSSLQHC